MRQIVGWTLEKTKSLINLAKDIRRPMTFYVLVTAGSFWSLWSIIPEDLTTLNWGGAFIAGCFTAIVIACCVLVYLFGVARLKVDPHYLDKPSAHE